MALGLRLAAILIGHTYRVRVDERNFNFGFEAGRIARSLATGHGYGNPFNGISGPTAWLPPFFPLLMALAFKLFGVYSRGAALFVMTLDSVFSALIAPALYEIAARCFDAYGLARRRSRLAAPVATWAAWLWAVYPAAMQYAVHWLWEMSLSACLFSWALVYTLRLRGTGELEGVRTASGPEANSFAVKSLFAMTQSAPGADLCLWLMLGLLWGLIALSNASLLLVAPATFVWPLWPSLREAARARRWQAFARPLGGAALATLAFAAVLAPWVIRNERVLHAFVPTRANLGVELWQSTHFDYYAIPWGHALPMWAGDPEFQRYIREGEVRYAAAKGVEARERIRAHPWPFARNILLRIQFFWFGVPHTSGPHPWNEFLRILNYSFPSLAALLGLALALRRHVAGAWMIFWSFVLLPLPYYLITVQARFRHPLEPLIAVLAVYLFRSSEPQMAK